MSLDWARGAVADATDIDPLTGVPTLQEFLTVELDLDRRCRQAPDRPPYAIVMAGVVGLRKLNQKYGFDAADAVLVELARRVREWSAARPGSFVGRVGGGDFAVLLWDKLADRPSLTARGLRYALTEQRLLIDGTDRVELRFVFREGPNTKPVRSDLLWDVQGEARLDSIRDLDRRVRELTGRAGLLAIETTDLRGRLEQAERLAQHDPLTGILNQRGLQAQVAVLDGPRAIAFVDVDNLRELNGADKQNWDGGDLALRGLARLLDSVPGVIAARWGGDEFTLIFPDTSAREAAESLVALNAQCRRELHVGKIPVSFSAGVAFAADQSRHELARRRALEAARAAKESGRGRVMVSEPGPETGMN